jgi:hypothetical protein
MTARGCASSTAARNGDGKVLLVIRGVERDADEEHDEGKEEDAGQDFHG